MIDLRVGLSERVRHTVVEEILRCDLHSDGLVWLLAERRFMSRILLRLRATVNLHRLERTRVRHEEQQGLVVAHEVTTVLQVDQRVGNDSPRSDCPGDASTVSGGLLSIDELLAFQWSLGHEHLELLWTQYAFLDLSSQLLLAPLPGSSDPGLITNHLVDCVARGVAHSGGTTRMAAQSLPRILLILDLDGGCLHISRDLAWSSEVATALVVMHDGSRAA